MLVLARKKNEAVMIGDIVVTVLDVRGDRVRLGIEAPKDVPIYRREVYERRRDGDQEKRDDRKMSDRKMAKRPNRATSRLE